MEDHETRRKIIREWMALPRNKRHTEEQVVAFAKKATQQNESIAVDGIRIANFSVIRTRKLWDGSHLALARYDWCRGASEPLTPLSLRDGFELLGQSCR
jgi:hypothetical protein